MTHRIVLAVVGGLGLAIAIAWGFRALFVYAFFVAFAGVVTLAAGLGGEWLRDASSRRFDDRHR